MDLWTTRDGFTGDSLLNIFSSGKSITAVAIASLVDAGLVRYEDKISQHWPEFGAQGKAEITLAQLMRSVDYRNFGVAKSLISDTRLDCHSWRAQCPERVF